MSAHNHDDEIMRRFGNTKTGKALQRKSDENLESKIVDAVLNCDISGLSKEDARAKLDAAIAAAVSSFKK